MTREGRRRLRVSLRIACAAAVALSWIPDAAARPTLQVLNSRVATVQDSGKLDEPTRDLLVDLYRQAIGNLEAVAALEVAAEEYRRAGRSAPVEAETLRAALEHRRSTDPIADLGDLSAKSSQNLTRQLDDEAANLTSVEARRAVLDAELEAARQRPGDVRVRIASARSLMEELAALTGERRTSGASPQIDEASRWVTETRLEALGAEIAMLEQELVSHDARVGLLKAQRDEADLAIERTRRRIEVLRGEVNERRRLEAELAMEQARAALEGASSAEPLVRELAEANLELVERLHQQVAALARLTSLERDWPRMSEIETAFRSARRKLELEGSRAPIGMAILAERARFPGAREHENERRRLGRRIVEVDLRLIENEEERHTLSDGEAYLERRIADAGQAPFDPAARRELDGLIVTRRALLARAISNDVDLQRRLYEAEDTLHRLADRMQAYDEFLAARLLWVRSTAAIDRAAFARLPAELAVYLAPGPWFETLRVAARRALEAPVFVLVVAIAVALGVGRRRIRVALTETGSAGGSGDDLAVRSTTRALGLSLLLAAPVPLVLVAAGLALSTADDASAFANGVGEALLRTARWIALPILVRVVFASGGLADRHLGWNATVVARLRRQLGWFVVVMFPTFLVLRTSLAVEPPPYAGGTFTFLCFATINAGLIAIVVAALHPTRGTIRPYLESRSSGARSRWAYLGFPVAVLIPLVLIALGWLGYGYAGQELLRRLVRSSWFLVAAWLGASLVRRWLVVTGRRLARARAAAKVGAITDGKPVAEGEVGESEVDLVALGADSRHLLNAAVLLIVVVAMAGIWGDVVPALGVFDDVELWNQTATVDGVQRSVPVTLFDLLVAAVTAVAGFLLARNLPSLLDIMLLRYGRVGAGARYTAGTLTRYAVTAIATFTVLNQLGASALQLGWAAAALGVGIGFGLQEIVANFICGLILLFERPVRVGDVITIGDASGTVSKIRIRATTIRDWEEKELIVPNKELITGRLLNWTLTDGVIRLLLEVGVAYGSDVDKALALIREAATENPRVVDHPEPRVNFERFGDSSLQLTLRAYISDVTERLAVTTELHRAIDRKFRENGVVIAFPQRDIHVRSGGPVS
jgi:potassium efflux system protein